MDQYGLIEINVGNKTSNDEYGISASIIYLMKTGSTPQTCQAYVMICSGTDARDVETFSLLLLY